MILCVTLNPVLDTTFFIDDFRPVYRTDAREAAYLAGGKGSNVARALAALGEPAGLVIALGGAMGRRVADLLAGEGTRTAVAWVSSETRLQLTVVDRHHEQRAFYAPSAAFTAQDGAAVRCAFAELLPEAEAVCLCGSAPPGRLAAELCPELIAAAHSRGLPVLLDSSGEGLRQGLAAGPELVKVNVAEAAGLLDRPIDTPAAEVGALVALQARTAGGCGWAILTLGPQGALAACGGEQWRALPPRVTALNPIGSGDAMTAGLMAGLRRGLPPEACFRLAMAAAAANTLTWDAGCIAREAVERLAGQVQIETLVR